MKEPQYPLIDTPLGQAAVYGCTSWPNAALLGYSIFPKDRIAAMTYDGTVIVAVVKSDGGLVFL